jgi:hypothetical protein
MLTDFETFKIPCEITLSNTVASSALNRRHVSAGNVMSSNVGAGVDATHEPTPRRGVEISNDHAAHLTNLLLATAEDPA